MRLFFSHRWRNIRRLAEAKRLGIPMPFPQSWTERGAGLPPSFTPGNRSAAELRAADRGYWEDTSFVPLAQGKN